MGTDWLGTDYYRESPALDPTGPAEGEVKVEKGGWWGGPAFAARSAYRHFEDPPAYRDAHIGFRIVTPGPTPAGAGAVEGARRRADDAGAARRSL